MPIDHRWGCAVRSCLSAHSNVAFPPLRSLPGSACWCCKLLQNEPGQQSGVGIVSNDLRDFLILGGPLAFYIAVVIGPMVYRPVIRIPPGDLEAIELFLRNHDEVRLLAVRLIPVIASQCRLSGRMVITASDRGRGKTRLMVWAKFGFVERQICIVVPCSFDEAKCQGRSGRFCDPIGGHSWPGPRATGLRTDANECSVLEHRPRRTCRTAPFAMATQVKGSAGTNGTLAIRAVAN